MKYLLMIYGNREKWESMPADAWPEAIARQEAFNAKYRQTGGLLGSSGLADAAQAKLVRRANGLPAVTDGPYLETKEYLHQLHVRDRRHRRRRQTGPRGGRRPGCAAGRRREHRPRGSRRRSGR